MKDKMIKYFYKIAEETSTLSTCASKQVGAVLVRDGRILAIGYNGTAPGQSHCNMMFVIPEGKTMGDRMRDLHHSWSIFNELHAEQNLIAFCAKNNINTDNTSLFITLSPCITCAKLLVAAGIKEVYYVEQYDLDSEGKKFLENNGVLTYSK